MIRKDPISFCLDKFGLSQNRLYTFVVRRIPNKVRAVIQTYGTPGMKRHLWDKEFSAGRWNHLQKTPEDDVYFFIEKYCRKGSILDLGCGSGSTGNELSPDAYQSYTGVDVSGIAVQKAIERTRKSGRVKKNEYLQSDICNYVPNKSYDVILFRESIYYIARGSIRSMLDRLAEHLKPCGVFIVRMSDREHYQPIVNLIEGNYQVVELFTPDGVETGSSMFSVGDIVDLLRLCGKLIQSSPSDRVSHYLWTQFSPATRNLLSNWDGALDSQLGVVLGEELDRIIHNGTIFEAQRFATVTLSPEAQRLLKQNHHGEKLFRLNRRLLEDAYPQEIWKNLRTIILVFRKQSALQQHPDPQ